MNLHHSTEIYPNYTNDHEWVDYQGTIAFMAVYSLKMNGCKKSQELSFQLLLEYKNKVAVLTPVLSKLYKCQ